MFSSQKGLEYLNTQRINAGMNPFKENSMLFKMANNHALYLMLNNQMGHGEGKEYKNFTGSTLSDRGAYVGYYGVISENISINDSDFINSIDGLFSAIYHRFIFLDFQSDEIGMVTYDSKSYVGHSLFVYNMGVSKIRKLCDGESFEGSGRYYDNVCKDKSFKISSEAIKKAKNKNLRASAKIVTWPYLNQTDVPPVFYEERPDPLPNCSVSGYPISVQFNSYYFKDFSLVSFKLYDQDNNEISHTKVINSENDPNNRFTKTQFALFPLKRLNYNSKYRVEVKYMVEGEEYEKIWSFTTKKIKYPILKINHTEQTLDVKSDKSYAIYISPRNCNDNFSSYTFEFSNSDVKVLQHNIIDKNTIHLKIQGELGKTLWIKLNNGLRFKLKISNR